MDFKRVIAAGFVGAMLFASARDLSAQLPLGRGRYDTGPGFRPDAAAEHVRVFGAISSSARKLARARGGEIPEARAFLVQIEKDAVFLQKQVPKWEARSRGGYPGQPLEFDPYFQNLRRTARALAKANKLADPQFLELARNLSKDLRAKAENCRLSADGLGKQITVTARTFRGTNELAGFEVYYAPMALLGEKAEHNKFSRLSSPTVMKNFPPGYYAVWLARGDTTNAHTALTIGGDGRPEFAFDLSIPEPLPASP